MASLVVRRGFVAVISGKEIKVLDEKSGNIRRLNIPETAFTNSKANDQSQKSETAAESSDGNSDRISCAEFSPCVKYFAACNDKKQLVIWDVTTWEVVSTGVLMRKASRLRFTHDSGKVLVADRSGDVYLLSVAEITKDQITTPILGHICLLLDMVISSDGNFVITCDRDEKIRVSHFPNAYNIQSFCLGHTEFVNSLSFLTRQPEILLSSSGDGSIKFWDFLNGREVLNINCVNYLSGNDKSQSATIDSESHRSRRLNQRNLLSQTVKKCICMPDRNIIIVLYFGACEMSVFSAKISDDAKEYHHVQNISFRKEVWDACFDETGYLWILQPIESDPVVVLKLTKDDNEKEQFNFVAVDEVTAKKTRLFNDDWEFFKESIDCPSEVAMMFKQWFDNMQGYLERKEERIKQKKKKKKFS